MTVLEGVATGWLSLPLHNGLPWRVRASRIESYVRDANNPNSVRVVTMSGDVADVKTTVDELAEAIAENDRRVKRSALAGVLT